MRDGLPKLKDFSRELQGISMLRWWGLLASPPTPSGYHPPTLRADSHSSVAYRAFNGMIYDWLERVVCVRGLPLLL